MARNTVELILSGNSTRLLNALGAGERGLKRFGGAARQEFERMRNAARSLEGRIASLGLSFGATMLIKQSAQMDKSLIQIGQTAEISRVKIAGLRKELFRMGRESGKPIEELQQGFNRAVQAGLKFDAALRVTESVNKAAAVTGAQNEILTKSLTSSAAIFNIDLSKPGQALLLLDKMRIAGKQGNAEMEDLAGIMPRVGFGAQRAGMDIEQTMAFVEGLSQAQQEPERLATLADNWTRLFTNNTYMQKVKKATGVEFFDDKGARRDALAVFADIKKKYDALRTDAQRHSYVSAFLEGADSETITASVAFLKGDFLKNARDFSSEISNAAGTIDREFPEAINNAVDQAGRLRNVMLTTADEFCQRIDAGITTAIKKLINSKEQGGWELSGKEIAGGSALAMLTAYLGKRFGGKIGKQLLGNLVGTAAGIAEGKVIEATTGVTPVFVTNWPAGSVIPGSPLPMNLDNAGKLKTWGQKAKDYAPLAMRMPIPPAYKLPLLAIGSATLGTAWMADIMNNPGSESNGDLFFDKEFSEWLQTKGVQNTINITVDKDRRVVANSDNMNTQINLKRGKF